VSLKQLRFSDLYIGQQASWLAGVPEMGDPIPVPEASQPDVQELRAKCAEMLNTNTHEEFSIKHDGISYRVSLLRSLNEVVFVLRRFPEQVPPLNRLGIHPAHLQLMMTYPLSGLVIIAGAYSNGKTTTAAALVCERLKVFGGVAVTIEDPPEMPMEGRHGEGVCYQTWVSAGEFASAARRNARYAPSIIFLGEVRDAETAIEAIKASTNGRLVICTVHSDNAISAIERMYMLANGAVGRSEDVAANLSSGLACVLHQKLVGEPRRPQVEFLWVPGTDEIAIRSHIKKASWEQLGSIIQLQRNRIRAQARPINTIQTSQ
jgi:twitching motility protein PilT